MENSQEKISISFGGITLSFDIGPDIPFERRKDLVEELRLSSKEVGRAAKKDKVCGHCGKLIPKGEPHTVHEFAIHYITGEQYEPVPSYGKGTLTCELEHSERTYIPTHIACNDDFIDYINRIDP